MPYNCLYLNKGNNSSVKGSILPKLIGYREFMVLIICTKNELNLTNRYWDMVPDRQKVRTDGRNGRTDDAKTISLRLRRGIINKYLISKKIIIHVHQCAYIQSWICLNMLTQKPDRKLIRNYIPQYRAAIIDKFVNITDYRRIQFMNISALGSAIQVWNCHDHHYAVSVRNEKTKNQIVAFYVINHVIDLPRLLSMGKFCL